MTRIPQRGKVGGCPAGAAAAPAGDSEKADRVLGAKISSAARSLITT